MSRICRGIKYLNNMETFYPSRMVRIHQCCSTGGARTPGGIPGYCRLYGGDQFEIDRFAIIATIINIIANK